MGNIHHYIIYLEALNSYTDRSNLPARWNWRRVRADGEVVSEGPGQASLAGCYSSVKAHMALAGDAAISIDLSDASTHCGPVGPGAGGAIEPPAPVLLVPESVRAPTNLGPA